MLKRREESDTYLTSVDIFVAEIAGEMNKYEELSANTVAFISYRRRLTADESLSVG